jgi:hypothetical protein
MSASGQSRRFHSARDMSASPRKGLNCCITAALLEPDLPIGAWYSFEIATGIVALDVTEAAGEAK